MSEDPTCHMRRQCIFTPFLFFSELVSTLLVGQVLTEFLHAPYQFRHEVRLGNLKEKKCSLCLALAFELASSFQFQASAVSLTVMWF